MDYTRGGFAEGFHGAWELMGVDSLILEIIGSSGLHLVSVQNVSHSSIQISSHISSSIHGGFVK